MAKFSEVLGGIAKDLVQLQVTSDLASWDILKEYKEKDILKYLDVPRFAVSDIKLNLKFAVSEHITIDHTETSTNYAENEWKSYFKKEILNKITHHFSGLSDNDKKSINSELKKVFLETEVPDFEIKSALDGNTKKTSTASINYAIDLYNKLPTRLNKKLGDTKELKSIISNNVETALNEKLPAIKKLANSKAALERDLEIIIEKDLLEKVPESNIHEISFNLTPDFIKILDDDKLEQ